MSGSRLVYHLQLLLFLFTAALLVFLSSFISVNHIAVHHSDNQHGPNQGSSVGKLFLLKQSKNHQVIIDREKIRSETDSHTASRLNPKEETVKQTEESGVSLPRSSDHKIDQSSQKKTEKIKDISFDKSGISESKKEEIVEPKISRRSDLSVPKDPAKPVEEANSISQKALSDKVHDSEAKNQVIKDPSHNLSEVDQSQKKIADQHITSHETDNKKQTNSSFKSAKKCFQWFPPRCPVHPAIHYWDEEADCYVSPLRHLHGLNAPIEKQKFIVFQPDLGGWNNIRMALEVVILIAKVTGRILVLPPDAVLYLLIVNKKWGDNKSNMDDYFDFARLRAGQGLETMEMAHFLRNVGGRGLLGAPLPEEAKKSPESLLRQPLWDYLAKSCFSQLWSPGKLYLGFNITKQGLGSFEGTSRWRMQEFSLGGKRALFPYNETLHQQRAIYFPGDESNRMLTHFYSYLFFATAKEDRLAKRWMRDRLRYHDEIFCVASRIIEKLLRFEGSEITTDKPKYVAFHIRRGDFQQKHTRLDAEVIVNLTNTLVPDRAQRIAYISTDEGNRSFFAPFFREYKAIYFLSDLRDGTGADAINQNYVGMIEQAVCAGADTFIGTPLSTFTAYITRMRGYLNRTISWPIVDQTNNETIGRYKLDRRGIYEKTFYYMRHHMYQLHTKPKVHFPLWIRDFVDVFKDIDEK